MTRPRPLLLLLFVQMLPATLLVPAIRPLFALQHHGNVGAMHAFMSLNMLGAILTAPWIGRLADRRTSIGLLAAKLSAADAVLLALCAAPLPTPLVLTARFLEGAAHVGTTTLLMTAISRRARANGEGRLMGLAGASIIFAIAAGNALGGVLVSRGTLLPFAAAIAIAILVVAACTLIPTQPVAAGNPARLAAGRLWLPLSAAFVERFAVGCIVVSFALYAHNRHGLSDGTIGWLFFALTFTFAIVMAPAGRLADRFGADALQPLGAIIYGTGLLLLLAVPAALLALPMILAGAGAALTFAPALASAVAIGASQRGAAMALMNAAGCLGMLLGPIVSGIVIAALGHDYSAAIVIAGAVVLTWGAKVLFQLRGSFGLSAFQP